MDGKILGYASEWALEAFKRLRGERGVWQVVSGPATHVRETPSNYRSGIDGKMRQGIKKSVHMVNMVHLLYRVYVVKSVVSGPRIYNVRYRVL